MDIQVAVLCDAANDSGGKLNLLGAFDTLTATEMPVLHPSCCVALRIGFGDVEEGDHRLGLHFVNDDGRPIMDSVEIPVQIALPEDAHFVTCNFIVNFQQLKFEAAGQHAVDISFDGKLVGSIPLNVRLTRPAPTAADE